MIHEVYNYVVDNVKKNPILSVVTLFNILGILFTLISNTHVDLYITRAEVQANAQQISQLTNTVSADHANIIILQQIAKDNVNAQQNLANEIQQMNTTFSQYLLDKVK